MEAVGIVVYSFLLTLVFALGSPWWAWSMLRSGRYRAGLGERLGLVSPALREEVAGKDVIWLHAVSVGEVLAAERLIAELEAALPGRIVAVSTTTAAGQQVARSRLPNNPVFYMPLDFAFTTRRYLSVLRPKLVLLMESELWPRMLVECRRTGVPVAVVNARVSDRSFPRYMRLRSLWKPLLRRVTIFLAQGEETARRLKQIGVPAETVIVTGNLKYDAPPPAENQLTERLRAALPAGAPLLVCGSTLDGEETMILHAWNTLEREGRVLLLAPRHPERFDEVAQLAGPDAIRLSRWQDVPLRGGSILVLDSLGSLAAIYQLAHVAFVGGSLVSRGGHNPLEPARFGVPVVMGPFYENFREVVDAMRAADAIRIVERDDLAQVLASADPAMGRRGQLLYEGMSGATARTVLALCELLS